MQHPLQEDVVRVKSLPGSLGEAVHLAGVLPVSLVVPTEWIGAVAIAQASRECCDESRGFGSGSFRSARAVGPALD